MRVAEAFEDVASSLAQLVPDKIITLKAPQAMSARVEQLISRKKNELITPEEITELEQFWRSTYLLA
ncbi:hypothetical protein ACFSUS_11055 [Spirosoma soli]|uniref:Uncharacterized protein n=1 Tax=Spirosoma soli TaxID=1770529 RepID=A0ABW5M4Y6_9BACT